MNKKSKIKFKKSVLGFFATFFAFALCIFYVSANKNPKVIVDKIDSASKGDTVKFNVKLENDKEYTGLILKFDYDKDALEYVKSKVTSESNEDEDISVHYDIAYNDVDSEGKIVWTFAIGTNNFANTDNALGTLTFKVRDTASGNYGINLSDIEMYKVENGEQTAIDVEGENGSIFVNVPVENVGLQKSDFEIQKGETDTINVLYTPEDTTDEKAFNFVSNDTSIATVDSNGKITAIKTGSTTINVTAFGQNFVANVSVVAPINEVKINGSKTELSKGEELNLTAIINPSDTTDEKTLTWKSSNESVATVDSNGLVKALKGGETTISATSVNNVIGTYKIKVVVPISDFSTSDQSFTLNKGESKKIVTTITPDDTTEDTGIVWKSSDENVVVVDNSGNVTALNGGNAIVTGTLENGKKVESNISVIVPIEKIELNKSNIELLPTQKQTLTTTITPVDTTEDKTITWTSSNESVATVNNGEVTAIGIGTTTITASVGSKQATATVKVLIPIENVVISENEVTLNKNESKKLTVTITPSNAEEDKTITWTSSDSSKVSVDKNGNIKALKATQNPVVITGTLKNGKKVECSVVVVVPITDVQINKTNITMNKGETDNLSLTILPQDTTDDKTIAWSSSDPTVATVDDNGLVTAVKAGNTVITAKVGNFEKKSSVEVVVPISKIEITNKINVLEKGNQVTFIPTILPIDTTENKTVTWTSSNENVAIVDSNGVVTAIGAGSATITASVGSKSDTVDLEVIIPITEFKLDKNTDEIIKGKTISLNPIIKPVDTTEDKTITWTSSNEKIATIDSEGVVKGISEGTATITGTLKNDMKVEFTVNVKIIPVEDIEISEEELTLKKNSGKILSISLKPYNATEGEKIEWTSSDPTVATVDENGNILALKKGTTTITAKMGNFVKTAEITVEEVPLESITLNSSEKKLSIGQNANLTVALNPIDTTDDVNVSFKSSDENIIKVSENGEITAVGAGKAIVTAITDGGLESSIEITVDALVSPKTGVASIGIYVSALLILSAIAFVIIKKTKKI